MRYRTFGDVTAGEVKEYFEVSAYRNILDMLKTLGTTVQSVGNKTAILAWDFIGLANQSAQGKGTRGAAIKAIGKAVGENGKESYYWWAKITARKNGFSFKKGDHTPPKPFNFRNGQEVAEVDRFLVDDLLELGRQIEWEMNRVRLPVPHNFRQYLSKLQKFPWRVEFENGKIVKYEKDPLAAVKLIEGINQLGHLKEVVETMRDEVRKEIDAAQLAEKVQEETIRRENEELISRAKAADEAAAREIAIREQKAEAYRADYRVLLERLRGATSRDEQLTLLSQLDTVTAAINGLVLDSAGRVSVPSVALLPTAEELAAVAAQVHAGAEAAKQEIDEEIKAVEQETKDLVTAAQSAQSDEELSALEKQIAEQQAVIAALQGEKALAVNASDTAKAANNAAASGDSVAAVDLLESTQPKKGAALPLIILSLLALAS